MSCSYHKPNYNVSLTATHISYLFRLSKGIYKKEPFSTRAFSDNFALLCCGETHRGFEISFHRARENRVRLQISEGSREGNKNKKLRCGPDCDISRKGCLPLSVISSSSHSVSYSHFGSLSLSPTPYFLGPFSDRKHYHHYRSLDTVRWMSKESD